MNDSTALWWVIKGPVVGSIMVSALGAKREAEQEESIERRERKGRCHRCILFCSDGAHIIQLFS